MFLFVNIYVYLWIYICTLKRACAVQKGGGQAKMVFAKIIWHVLNMAVQTHPTEHLKSSQNHAYSSSFWHKTVATPSIYTDSEVDKVARASTCVSCFRRAIADTKRNKHPLLLAEKTPQGIQTQLLADRKKRTSFSTVGIEHRCLWSYGKLIARNTAI